MHEYSSLAKEVGRIDFFIRAHSCNSWQTLFAVRQKQAEPWQNKTAASGILPQNYQSDCLCISIRDVMAQINAVLQPLCIEGDLIVTWCLHSFY